jgi:hypothetical protein
VRSGLALSKTQKDIEHRRRKTIENYKRWSVVTRFGLLELLAKTPNRTNRVLLEVRRAHFEVHRFST